MSQLENLLTKEDETEEAKLLERKTERKKI